MKLFHRLFWFSVIALTVLSGCTAKNNAKSPSTGTNQNSVKQNSYLAENPIDNLSKEMLDGESLFYQADPEQYVQEVSDAYAAIPELSQIVDGKLLPAVLSKGPVSQGKAASGNLQGRAAAVPPAACLRDQVPGAGGGACPNVCVMAAAFAAATACAYAEARACASCSDGNGNSITVCSWARSQSCARAFGFGFAAACSNGVGVGIGGGSVGGGVDGGIGISSARSLFDNRSAAPVACPMPTVFPSPTATPSITPAPTPAGG